MRLVASPCSQYVDINGEVGWHRTMIDRYDAAAREKGVVLVPSAGFDSIPSDLGAHWMASRIRERFGAPARRVTCYVSLRGNFSGGTVASGILAEETVPTAAQLARRFPDASCPRPHHMHMHMPSPLRLARLVPAPPSDPDPRGSHGAARRAPRPLLPRRRARGRPAG